MANLTNARWIAEVRLMQNNFPAFEPFASDGLLGGGTVGFKGALKGRSGNVYQVEIRGSGSGYPAQAPKIFIRPRVGPNWYLDDSLCVNRPWRPQRDTFAQQVLYAAAYLKQHG